MYNVAAPESWTALLGEARELLVELSAAYQQVMICHSRGNMMAKRSKMQASGILGLSIVQHQQPCHAQDWLFGQAPGVALLGEADLDVSTSSSSMYCLFSQHALYAGGLALIM